MIFVTSLDIKITGSFSFGNMAAIFIRDPDRNVIELDAYSDAQTTAGIRLRRTSLKSVVTLTSTGYLLAADIVLFVHVMFVFFVVVGLLLIFVGLACGWQWVRNFWFRTIHLAAIGVVVLQSLAWCFVPADDT